MFMEGLNWAARLVPTTFLLLIILFGLALTVSGILQLIQPTEYQFDSRKKAYLKNGHIKATVDQLNGVGFSKRSTKDHSSYYQLFLDLKTGKQIKLMRTNSFERAEELAQEINKMLDLPGTSSTFINKYAPTFGLIFLAVFLLILIFGTVSGLMKSTYLPYSGREELIKNRNPKGVLFERKLNGEWGWYENGDENRDGKYVGEVALGKPNGLGTYDYSDGDRYEGEWRGGRRHGNGTYTYQDGSKYIGEFKDGSLNGQGTYTFHDGGKYEGGWKDSKKHGQGTFTYGKGKWEGDKYIGEYKYGKRHGQGTYTYGKGKWKGDKYVGEYKEGEFHGQGTYTSSNGNKYEGEWKGGMRHGLGKGEWGEDKYEGMWKDDKKHGRGTFTWSSGDEALGEWRYGNPWNVDYFDNKGKFLGRFLDGV